MYFDIFRENLRLLMSLRNMKQVSLSKCSGVSKSRINQLLNDPEASITLDNMEKISDALGVTLTALLTPLDHNHEAFKKFFELERSVLPPSGHEYVEGYLLPQHAKEFRSKAKFPEIPAILLKKQ